jgi:hypothetical protein
MERMREGNKKIRWIMIQAANTAVRTDDKDDKDDKDNVVYAKE